MLKKLSKKAQTTAEYAILIAIVVGAVVAMQIYIKRGIQGRVRDVVDYTGTDMFQSANENTNFTFSNAANGGQYEPYYANTTTQSTQQATESESLSEGGASGKSSNATSTSQRTGTTGF